MKFLCSVALTVFLVSAVGCQPKDAGSTAVNSTAAGSAYRIDNEPVGALPVGEARAKTEHGQDVAIIGRIGGSSQPFIEGLAAFTIVDPKVPHCAADEGCPTPWDYCCETDAVKGNIATVKIVDESGKPVAQNARDLLKVKELSMVVVKGKAKRDNEGNLTIAAHQVFVRQGE